MTEKNVKINLWVGIFSLTIVVVSCILIIFFLGKVNPFQSSVTIRVNFDNVEGLKVGSSVNLKGLSVGRVIDIRLTVSPDKDEPVHQVSLLIANQEEYLRWITKDSKIEIVNDNLFGDKHIEIGFASTGERIKDGDLIVGEKTTSINQVLQNVTAITKKVEAMVENFGGMAGNGTANTGIAATFSDLQVAIRTVTSVAKNLKEASKATAKVDLKTTIANLNDTLVNFKQFAKKGNELLSKAEGQNFQGTITDLKNAVKKFESVGKTLENNLGGQKGQMVLFLVISMVKDFSKTAKNLSNLTGELSQTMKTANTQSKEFKKTMADLQTTAQNLRRISQGIADVMDAPGNFYNRIFRRGKKPAKKK